MTSTIAPWNMAVVAPPATRPSMIAKRGTGATSVSFRNPNCRSHSISMPEKIAEKMMLIATMPGTRNWM